MSQTKAELIKGLNINASAPATALNIDSSGRVGIGTTSPGYPLSIKTITDGGQSIFDLNNEDVGNYGGLRVHLGNTDRECRLEATYNSSFFTFYTAGSSGAGTERARIDNSGRLLVGTSTSLVNGWGGSGSFQLASNSFTVSQIYSYTSTGADGYGSYFELNRARGTQASPSVVTSGDELGEINFYGHDGSGFIRSASIRSYVDGTPGTNDMPGRLVFSTTADGASSPTERMRIPNGGGLSVGSTVSPNALTQTSGIRLGDSTVASHTFTNITTSPVTIANGVGVGGLAFVQAFNTSTGAQYTGIIMWRSGVVAVVSESNSLGFALTYSVSGSTLRLQTASGTISGSVITLGG